MENDFIQGNLKTDNSKTEIFTGSLLTPFRHSPVNFVFLLNFSGINKRKL